MSGSDRADADLVGSLPLFSGLSRGDCRKVAAIARLEEAPAGALLFHEGDPPDAVHVIVEGRIASSVRLGPEGDTVVLTLGPGELLGWSALLDRERRVASARIVEAARLLTLPAGPLGKLCEADHDIGYAIMKATVAVLGVRLHDTRLQMVDMYRPAEE
jgi:CRP-like cAMP-binding protein